MTKRRYRVTLCLQWCTLHWHINYYALRKCVCNKASIEPWVWLKQDVASHVSDGMIKLLSETWVSRNCLRTGNWNRNAVNTKRRWWPHREAAQYVTGSANPLHYPVKRQLHSRKPNPVSTSEVNITICEQLTILNGTEVGSLGTCLYSRLNTQGYCNHKNVDTETNTLPASGSAAAWEAGALRQFRLKVFFYDIINYSVLRTP